jgi:hypothetical protein
VLVDDLSNRSRAVIVARSLNWSAMMVLPLARRTALVGRGLVLLFSEEVVK